MLRPPREGPWLLGAGGVAAASGLFLAFISGATWGFIVMGLLILLATLFVTRFLYGFPHRPPSATQHQWKHGQPRRDMTAKNNAFRDQQQELLQELFDLDRAFEANKIKQAEYLQRRAKAKAGLRTLMSSEIAEQIVRSGGTGVS